MNGKVNAISLQKSLLQNNLLNDMSHRDALFSSLNSNCNKNVITPSDLKNVDDKTILNTNLQQRQNDINFKTIPPIILNEDYTIYNGRHRSFLAKLTKNSIRAYRRINKPNNHTNILKIKSYLT